MGPTYVARMIDEASISSRVAVLLKQGGGSSCKRRSDGVDEGKEEVELYNKHCFILARSRVYAQKERGKGNHWTSHVASETRRCDVA